MADQPQSYVEDSAGTFGSGWTPAKAAAASAAAPKDTPMQAAARAQQVPGSATGIYPQPAPMTGDTATGQGAPIPTVADIVARLQSGNPNANASNVVVAPDSRTNEWNANMERFGTGFPSEAEGGSNQPFPQGQDPYPATHLIRARNGKVVVGSGPAPTDGHPLLADARAAGQSLNDHSKLMEEALGLQQKAMVDADTHGAFSALHEHPLDPTSPTYLKDRAAMQAQFPHADLDKHFKIYDDAFARHSKASESIGADQYDPDSHARQMFTSTLKKTGDINQAKQAADRTAKSEASMQKHFANGDLHAADFGTAEVDAQGNPAAGHWSTTGLFHSDQGNPLYGTPNYQAIENLATNRAGTRATEAHNSTLNKADDATITRLSKTTPQAGSVEEKLLQEAKDRRLTRGQPLITNEPNKFLPGTKKPNPEHNIWEAQQRLGPLGSAGLAGTQPAGQQAAGAKPNIDNYRAISVTP